MNKRISTVCFLVEENKILLANIEYGANNRKWTGIGGFIEEGESPEDAVVREIQEETCIIVEKENLVRVLELDIDIRLIVFKASKWSGELKIKDKSLKELRWFDSDQIPYDQMYPGNEDWIPELFKN